MSDIANIVRGLIVHVVSIFDTIWVKILLKIIVLVSINFYNFALVFNFRQN